MIDEVKIKLAAGKGGNGIVSFRREKYIPKGGPDGGDGGKGGDIYIQSDNQIDDLSYYNRIKYFKADNGQNGKNKKMYGKNATDLILKVPVGTIIYKTEKKLKKIFDFTKNNQKIIICKGGSGGLGNVHFKSSTNQTPKQSTKGKYGEKKEIYLELQMIADVGIVGLPNAGKSTLVNRIAKSSYKVANYQFTTLSPNIGVLKWQNKIIRFADIPGLIKDASQGVGIGLKFLKHIKRTKILIHLIDSTSEDMQADIETINKELEKYDKQLLKKPTLLVVNKIDLINKDKKNKIIKYDKDIILISAKNNKNINKLINKIINLLKA